SGSFAGQLLSISCVKVSHPEHGFGSLVPAECPDPRELNFEPSRIEHRLDDELAMPALVGREAVVDLAICKLVVSLEPHRCPVAVHGPEPNEVVLGRLSLPIGKLVVAANNLQERLALGSERFSLLVNDCLKLSLHRLAQRPSHSGRSGR